MCKKKAQKRHEDERLEMVGRKMMNGGKGGDVFFGLAGEGLFNPQKHKS